MNNITLDEETALLSDGHLEAQQGNLLPENLSLQLLTLKTTMLLALLSGQRCQTIHALDVSHMTLTDENCIFYIQKLLKTPRPGKHLGRLEFRNSEEDKKLCIVTVLKEYFIVPS